MKQPHITPDEVDTLYKTLLYYTDTVNYVQHPEDIFLDRHEPNILIDRGRQAREAVQLLRKIRRG